MKVKMQKLPTIEWVYRWIDVFTFFDYSDKVRDTAYTLVEERADKIVGKHPSTAAVTALYIACERHGEKFRLERITSIMKAYLAHRKMDWGMRSGTTGMEQILKRVNIWKSDLGLK